MTCTRLIQQDHYNSRTHAGRANSEDNPAQHFALKLRGLSPAPHANRCPKHLQPIRPSGSLNRGLQCRLRDTAILISLRLTVSASRHCNPYFVRRSRFGRSAASGRRVDRPRQQAVPATGSPRDASRPPAWRSDYDGQRDEVRYRLDERCSPCLRLRRPPPSHATNPTSRLRPRTPRDTANAARVSCAADPSR
jgi:hypothetical protein